MSADNEVFDIFCLDVAARTRKLNKCLKLARAGDMGGVHDSRTTSRCLRVEIGIMADAAVFEEAPTRRVRHRLHRIERSLGKVRDTDVFLANLATYRRKHPKTREGLSELTHALESRRRKAARTARRESLSSKARRHLIEDLRRLLRRGKARAAVSKATAAPFQELAREQVSREYAALRAFTAELPGNADTLHHFRSACRALRVAVALFKEALPAIEPMARELFTFQSQIGEMHDHHVAAMLIAKWKSSGKLRARPELNGYEKWRTEEESRLRSHLEKRWLAVLGESFHKKLEHALGA